MSGRIAARGLIEWPARLPALVDLVCLPGAGAGASVFHGWSAGLPAWTSLIAVQMPGREDRSDEPLATSLTDLADDIAASYLGLRRDARPVLLFGHSMGGALAFETARALSAGRRPPAALIAAASAPARGGASGPCDLDALRRLIERYGPSRSAALSDEAVFAALAPVISADMDMLRQHRTDGVTDIPILVLSGATDPVVSEADAARWRAHTTVPVKQMTIAGDHFFPFGDGRDEVLRLVTGRLSAARKR